jgi:hypothetical protein
MSGIRWPTKEEDALWEKNHREDCTSKNGCCTRAKRVSETEARLKCLCGWSTVIPYSADWEEFCKDWDEKRLGHRSIG